MYRMRKGTIQGLTGQTHYNVVVLGGVKAGKTALVTQYMFNSLKQSYKPTIEDCYRTLAQLPNGKYKTVNIVDTAGSMEFPAMRELRIRSATAVVIVYNVANPDSVAMVSTIKKQVQKIREYDEVPIVVVGNLRGSQKEKLTYQQQVPCGVMEDSCCQHLYRDLSDAKRCKEIFDEVIEICYDSNTGLVQVFNSSMRKNEDKENQPRKRSIFSYLSFRRKKSHRSIPRAKSIT